jgi:hypothetical protein
MAVEVRAIGFCTSASALQGGVTCAWNASRPIRPIELRDRLRNAARNTLRSPISSSLCVLWTELACFAVGQGPVEKTLGRTMARPWQPSHATGHDFAKSPAQKGSSNIRTKTVTCRAGVLNAADGILDLALALSALPSDWSLASPVTLPTVSLMGRP